MRALSADAEGARETLINLLVLAGLAPATADRAELTGTAPLLASSFHVGVAAQASIAGAALAATEFDRQRGSTSLLPADHCLGGSLPCKKCISFLSVSCVCPEPSWLK